jgi:hypothetical protein
MIQKVYFAVTVMQVYSSTSVYTEPKVNGWKYVKCMNANIYALFFVTWTTC